MANVAAGNFIDDSGTATSSSDNVNAMVGTAMLIAGAAMNGSCNARLRSGKFRKKSGKFGKKSGKFGKSSDVGI